MENFRKLQKLQKLKEFISKNLLKEKNGSLLFTIKNF